MDKEQKQKRLAQIMRICEGIEARASAEDRELSLEEREEFDGLEAEFRELNDSLDVADFAEGFQSRGRHAMPQIPQDQMRPEYPNSPGAMPRVGGRVGTHGFQNLGEMALAVREAARVSKGGHVDSRLVKNAPTTTSVEGVGTDGGFLIPPDFRADIWEKVTGETSLLPRTDQIVTTSSTIVQPADEQPPWATTGVQVYWGSETTQLTQSKVALEDKTLRLNKLTALIPVSEELFEDAPMLDKYLKRKVSSLFDWQITYRIIRGTGAGEPLGYLNSASLVSVAKESGQAADTVVAENILNMEARMYGPSLQNAIWLAHNTCKPQLQKLYLRIPDAAGTDYVGGQFIYLPDNRIAGAPYGTLLGRPLLFSEACPPLGDQGDISLVDFKQYWTAIRRGHPKADVSIHLWFDYDVMAYRFILRIAGMPYWKSKITSTDGSTTYSWAVTLDERGE